MTINTDKYHLIVSGHQEEAIYASVEDALLWVKNSVELLSLFVDLKLLFNIHLQTISKKASQKLTAILRLSNITSQDKRIVMLTRFFETALIKLCTMLQEEIVILWEIYLLMVYKH